MRVLLLSLAVPLALAASPAPTVPTPRPTITPAPKSECNYEEDANGPFALDCLQALFLAKGCSIRGLSYPTEIGDEDDGDKEIYNAMTWAEVQTHMQTMADADDQVTSCRGPPTASPTQEPTTSPVTKHPTPKPTMVPTEHTPAPTYAGNYGWKELFKATKTGVEENNPNVYANAAALKEALYDDCVKAGYARQYDATQYIVQLELYDADDADAVDTFIDYFTVVPAAAKNDDDVPTGQYTSICDMLRMEDDDGNAVQALWSDNPEGPYWQYGDDDKLVHNRVLPKWIHEDGRGFGAVSDTDLDAVVASYVMKITSARSFNPCVERVDVSVDGFGFEACKRVGKDGQVWSEEAVECGDGDGESNLHYALANRMFATCNSRCVYQPNYNHQDDDEAEQESQFWHWQSGGGGCWKPRKEYDDGEYQNCDPNADSNKVAEANTDAQVARATEFEAEYAFVLERQAALCTERCDYVRGWTYVQGSCYKVISHSDYDGANGDTNFLKAKAMCGDLRDDANLASIASEDENTAVAELCDGKCWLGLDHAQVGDAGGKWLDGSELIWSNWEGGYEGNSMKNDGDETDIYLTINNGVWEYITPDQQLEGVCESPANHDEAASNKERAMTCMLEDESKVMETNHFAKLDIAESGFTDAGNPGNLVLKVTVPKYMFNPIITFENATNDAAEYNWEYGNGAWEVTANTDDCAEAMALEGTIAWTVFNLGGAGGVQRLAEYFDADDGAVDTNTDRSQDDNFSNSKYLFGAVMRIETTQPVEAWVDNTGEDDATDRKKRTKTFMRNVVARIPFVLKFQKTVTVTTDVDIISTKFNYKTVAAIIQSIQYETQFFEAPYAKIRLQIRTKSQYPYLFNKNVESVDMFSVSGVKADPVDDKDGVANGQDDSNNNVDMAIAHLADDVNCTFTNPDHQREGDICTQEWMVTLVPNKNVCYATGEYTIVYEADCFYGKDVCYLPRDAAGDEITTVAFTFKVQTSKFCPQVADEVDLAGKMVVTGRESFKPTDQSVEDATEGQYYLQGETIHLLADVTSEKAVITSTKVIMVELVQDLSQLVMTGYNRVPFDPSSEDLTVWIRDSDFVDGTVTITGDNGATECELMTDDDVFDSGSDFGEGDGAYEFSALEAGFKILLHAKAFPVNVDSFGSKTLVATLEVTYEALNGDSRRRLLGADRSADLRSRARFDLTAFQPESITEAQGDAVTLSMELTLQKSKITRNNVRGFVQSFEDAIRTSIAAESSDRVMDDQVAVDSVFSNDVKIWSRPTYGDVNVAKRRLQAGNGNQKMRIDFTITRGRRNAASVADMLTIFDKQLRSPSSPLGRQPIFYGAVVHTCTVLKSENVDTQNDRESGIKSEEPGLPHGEAPGFNDAREESSASRSLPALLAAFLALVAMW